MQSLKELLDILFSRAALGGKFFFLYGGLAAFQMWRLDLLHAPMITSLCVIFAWFVLWVISTFRFPRWTMALPFLFLGWVTVEATLPALTDAIRVQARSLNSWIEQRFVDIDDAAASALTSDEEVPEPTPTSPPERQLFILTEPTDEPEQEVPADVDDGLQPVIETNPHAPKLRPVKEHH